MCISGIVGSANNPLAVPRGTALDQSTNTLYVADTNNHRVISYQLGSLTGTLVVGGNGAGANNTQL